MSLPTWSLSPDRTKLTISFPTDPPVAFELEADEVDDMIANTAELRAAMQPSIPMTDPDPGHRMRIIPGTGRWYVSPLDDGGKLLSLLHPGYRWVSMAFEDEQAARLGSKLIEPFK